MYSGVRVAAPATVASAQVMLKVDVKVGDPVTPGPVELDYPALLDDPFRLVGYPIETVLAEKLVTMIERAATTTRDRDFADVWTLARHHAISAQILVAAIAATADHRGVELRPLEPLLAPLAQLREAACAGFLARPDRRSGRPGHGVRDRRAPPLRRGGSRFDWSRDVPDGPTTHPSKQLRPADSSARWRSMTRVGGSYMPS